MQLHSSTRIVSNGSASVIDKTIGTEDDEWDKTVLP